MITTKETSQTKIRTTLYLTKENKRLLDGIPRGKKTELMNKAIANAFAELEREKNSKNFVEKMAAIQPVVSEYSAVDMVNMLRTGKESQLLDNKITDEE